MVVLAHRQLIPFWSYRRSCYILVPMRFMHMKKMSVMHTSVWWQRNFFILFILLLGTGQACRSVTSKPLLKSLLWKGSRKVLTTIVNIQFAWVDFLSSPFKQSTRVLTFVPIWSCSWVSTYTKKDFYVNPPPEYFQWSYAPETWNCSAGNYWQPCASDIKTLLPFDPGQWGQINQLCFKHFQPLGEWLYFWCQFSDIWISRFAEFIGRFLKSERIHVELAKPLKICAPKF